MNAPDTAGRLKLYAGVALAGSITALALLSFVWTPWDVQNLDIAHRLAGLSAAHPFGTDALGRDQLSLLMWGGRNSLFVALSAVLCGLVFGVPVGLWAAARGGFADQLLMRGSDLVFAFPAVLLAVLLSASLGPGAINAVLAIGLFNVPVFAKVTRGLAQVQWQHAFVLAARVAGKNRLRISWEHILPNITVGIGAQAAIQFSMAIVAEAGLSYIGLGVQPPVPSWGRALSEAQTLIDIAPHLALFPGLAIFLAVLGFNLLGEGLSEYFAPKRRM